MQQTYVWRVAALLLLFFGIVLPPILPEAANVGFLVLGAAGLTALIMGRRFRLLLHPSALLPLIATALVALALSMTASGPAGYQPLLILAPLWLVAPAASLLVSYRVPTDDIAITALVAVIAAAGLAVFDGVIVGTGRAGSLVNNPIHFAAVTITVGFVALVGLQSKSAWLRRIVPVAPVLAIVAVWLSGSRGPLLAVPPMCLAALLVLGFIRLQRRWAWALTISAALLIALVGTWLWISPYATGIPAAGEVVAYLRYGVTADHSVATRIVMYESGIRAFLASPWYGHGADFFAKVGTFVPQDVSYPPFDHLHSDIIDFAAMAGSLGLCAYGLLLMAGPAALVAGANRPAAALIVIPVVTGYAVMGLTNAMIGILTQTVLFALVLALTTALASEPSHLSKAYQPD